MFKKAREISIDPKQPWLDDPFGRQATGQVLADLLEAVDQPFVIAVNGVWGSGKTVFLRRFEAELESRALPSPTIWVDAWRTDWHTDPLLALVEATEQRLKRDPKLSRRSTLPRKLVGSAMALAPSAAGAIGGALVPGAGSFAEAVVKRGADAIQAFSDRKDAAETLERSLKDARDALLHRAKGAPLQGHVTIIVDELDRCRPDYAISMLERIKHLFTLQGFVFVIATDSHNLRSAVQTVYGPETDGERYLRRFFDFELHLKSPTADQFAVVLREQFGLDSLLSKGQSWENLERALVTNAHQDPAMLRSEAAPWAEATLAFRDFARVAQIPLRDQSQAFTAMCAMLARKDIPALFPPLAAYLACLRFSDQEAFAEILRSGGIGIGQLKPPDGVSPDTHRYLQALGTILRSSDATYAETYDGWRRIAEGFGGNVSDRPVYARMLWRLKQVHGPDDVRLGIQKMLYLLDAVGS